MMPNEGQNKQIESSENLTTDIPRLNELDAQWTQVFEVVWDKHTFIRFPQTLL